MIHCRLWPFLVGTALAQFLNLLVGAVITQLILQDLYLLPKKIISLLLINICVDLLVYLILDLQHLDFLEHVLEQECTAVRNVFSFEDLLFLANLNIEIGRKEVDEK